MNPFSEADNLEMKLADWEGAYVRLWSFAAGHDTLVIELTRGPQGSREYKYLIFFGCERINTPTSTVLFTVKHFAVNKEKACFQSGDIMIIHEFWFLQDSDPKFFS